MRREFWNGKRVLITGHTGFKGSWLAFWLRMLGADVCGYALEPDTSPSLFENLNLEREIKSTIGDIRDREKFEKLLFNFKPEIIFHLAAQSLVRRSYRQPLDTYTTNVIGTVNILEAVRQVDYVRAVVVVTTDKVYENKESHRAYREDEPLGGFDPYSSSKACTEIAVAAYRNSFFGASNCLIATARAGNVIGGGDWSEDRLLPDVFRSLLFREELRIRNVGSIRPWQHTLEPLAGYMQLAEKLFSGERNFADAWNFGPREQDSMAVEKVLDEISNAWGAPVVWETASGEHPHETKILKLDSRKATTELGWRPKLTFTEAVRLTTDWYHAFREGRDLRTFTASQIDFYQAKNAD